MITKRHRNDRGPTNAGWLNSMHTFSFGHYLDYEHMGFGPLRVINEDRVIPGAGFGTHPHNNMEIISYVLDGALEHKDSMGNGSIIKPGDIQRMSAGTGVTHSEFNHSKSEGVHFLQIWFLPEEGNIEPSYEQKSFAAAEKQGQLKLVMSPDGRDGSVTINQQVDMYAGLFKENETTEFIPRPNTIQWMQIARGQINVNGETIQEGDGLAIKDEEKLVLDNAQNAEVILFDMKV
ncbi:pirin family protein [Curvivirga aplysinae]|uniref:pirin family protein n=1 Tax=Curvivirga aplysinae TaxID=2529852 RepID=UPI0012BB6E08|nr:pirin family protein [Curvivirga aplysinae]MTI09947.1 pirin family protein [Curvivirga aplysinae]